MLKKFWMAIMTILCSIGITIAVSYAWFLNDENVDPIAQGYSGSAYFAYGDGGSTDNGGKPYGINQPRHLYNLAWLCYLFPETYANKNYEIDPSLQGSLDMHGWTLPPIGTNANPFTGVFNGHGKTITNLTTSNNIADYNNKAKPNTVNSISGCEVIGFFGKIAKNNNETTAKVQDLYLQNTTVKTATQATCVGIVAGVVDAKIENIGVINSGLNLGNSTHDAVSNYSSNVSDYAVVGYASEQYTTTVANKKTIIYNPTTSYTHFNYGGMGGATAWGGSMNFSDMFSRFLITRNNTTYTTVSGKGYNFDYVYREIIKSDGTSYTEGGTRNSVVDTYVGGDGNQHWYQRRYLYEGANYNIGETSIENLTAQQKLAANGEYKRALRAEADTITDPKTGSGSDERFNYINALYKDVYTITKDGNSLTGYKIHDGNGNYLSYNEDNDEFENVRVESNASIWILEDGGLFTYDEEEYSETIIRYLNGTTDLYQNLTSTKTTNWTWENNTFKYNYNGQDYYLKYFHNQWTVMPTYVLGDGDGNYLSYDTEDGICRTGLNNATIWAFSNNSTLSGRIYNTDYVFLNNNNGTLTTSNYQNASIWSNDGVGLNNDGYYIQYNNSDWVISRPLDFYIFEGNNYLSTINGTSLYNQTGTGTIWTFQYNDGNPYGYISTSINNLNYYLYNNNGVLGITNDTSLRTSFSNDGSRIYCTYNYNNYYLDYDSGWVLTPSLQYYISYTVGGITHYLSRNGSSLRDETDIDDATAWTFSNSGANPSGTISSGGYYLYYTSTSILSLNSNNSTSFTNTNGRLYSGQGSIQYYNGVWICGSLRPISFNGGYMSTNGSSFSNSNTPYLWVFSNYNTSTNQTLLYTVINGNINYLRYNSGSLSIGTSTTNNSWRINGNGQIYNDYDDTYYIQKINNTWGLYRRYYAYISYQTHYLSNNGTSLSDETSLSSATLWQFSTDGDKPQGTIHPTLDNTNRYIYYDSTTLSRYETTWEINTTNRLRYRYWGTNYYIRYDNGWKTSNGSTGYSLTWTLPCGVVGDAENQILSYTTILGKYKAANIDFNINEKNSSINRTEVSTYKYRSVKSTVASEFNYVPLITKMNGTNSTLMVDDNNTGYLIGGSHESSTQKADIRVSEYYMSNISSCVNRTGTGDSAKFSSFKDDSIRTYYVNGNTITRSQIIDSSATIQENSANLVRYTKAKAGLQEIFNNQSNIYGLHFMNAQISIDHLVTAPLVYINGTYYKNYQMPEDCIDFRLSKEGYITFFAGTYYSGNNSFFSLNVIERNENNEITNIKHIHKIYEDLQRQTENDPHYVYVFENESDPYSTNNRYSLKFDYRMIEQPTGTLGSTNIYYFEIPVNEGEFALGSVNGRTGAYLFYLDIGANAAPVDRTIITQKQKVEVKTYKYASGIQILDENDSSYVTDLDSCVATITTSNTGSITISRSGNVVTFNQSLTSYYVGDNISAVYNNIDLEKTAISTVTNTRNMLKYIDYDIAKERLYITTIENDGTNNISYNVLRILDDNGTIREIEIINDTITSKELIEGAEYGLVDNQGYQVYQFDSNKNILVDNDGTTHNFTIVSFSTGNDVILDYTSKLDSVTNIENLNQVINMVPIRVTGTDSTLGITNGKKTVTIGVAPNTEQVELEHVYKLDGNDILISAPGYSTFVNTDTVSSNYNFYINGVKVSAVSNYTIQGNVIYTQTSDTTTGSNKGYYIITELYSISNSSTPQADGLYEYNNGSFVLTSDSSRSSIKIYYEKVDGYIPAKINDIITTINNNPSNGGYYEITSDYNAE